MDWGWFRKLGGLWELLKGFHLEKLDRFAILDLGLEGLPNWRSTGIGG